MIPFEMFRIDKSIETENKLVIAKAGSSGEQEVTAGWQGFFCWSDENAVLSDSTQFCEYTKNH